MATKNIAKTWAEKCAKSNGTMVMLPDILSAESEEIEKLRVEVEAKAAEFNELNLALENKAQNFWYKVRMALKEAQVPGALEKTLGWNEEAKKDGMKVVNIVTSMNRGMPM